MTVFELPSSSSKVTSTESPLFASFGKSIDTEPSSSAVNPGLLGAVTSASLPLLSPPWFLLAKKIANALPIEPATHKNRPIPSSLSERVPVSPATKCSKTGPS